MKKLTILFAAILFALFTISACTGKSGEAKTDKEETPVNNDALTTKDTGTQVPPIADNNNPADTGKTAVAANPNVKTMTMTFVGYEEGDYPHLLFKDSATGKEEDFRFTADNNYSGIPILLEDKNAAFGEKANPKYLNKMFIVETTKKQVVDADLQGVAFKTKAWVITSLKLK